MNRGRKNDFLKVRIPAEGSGRHGTTTIDFLHIFYEDKYFAISRHNRYFYLLFCKFFFAINKLNAIVAIVFFIIFGLK